MAEFVTYLPCISMVGKRKKKKISLSWNYYCNYHKNYKGIIKKHFMELYEDFMPDFPINNITQITYTLYTVDRRQCDVANVCGLVDKFFCDSMIECGIIKDDSFKYVPKILYEYGGIAKVRAVKVTISYT